MAWTSDIIWCDPKFASVSDKAFRAYIHGNSYSSGFLLRGHLTSGHLKTIGVTAKVRAELIAAALWHEAPGGGIFINDWDEHNGKRDDRREKDRNRKREQRARERAERPQDSPQDVPVDSPHLRRALKEVKEVTGDGVRGESVTQGRTAPDIAHNIQQSLEEAS